jgi:hypothetical protein
MEPLFAARWINLTIQIGVLNGAAGAARLFHIAKSSVFEATIFGHIGRVVRPELKTLCSGAKVCEASLTDSSGQ